MLNLLDLQLLCSFALGFCSLGKFVGKRQSLAPLQPVLLFLKGAKIDKLVVFSLKACLCVRLLDS